MEEINIYRGKSVICITTGEIFLSISNAQKNIPKVTVYGNAVMVLQTHLESCQMDKIKMKIL